MKQKLIFFAGMMSALLMSACDDDSIKLNATLAGEGEDCTLNDCEDGLTCDEESQVCVKSEEIPPSDLCANKKCDTNQVCKNGKCVAKDKENGGECGGKTCAEDEICNNATCINEDRVCPDTICAEDEICYKDKECLKRGNCDGHACNEGQLCLNGICHDPGDCGGLTCNSNEVCEKNVCRQYGTCGGFKCFSDEVCNFDECLPQGPCGGALCKDTQFCANGHCQNKELCNDIYCAPGQVCVDGVCANGPQCVIDEKFLTRCGDNCCTEKEFCGDRSHCCSYENACGQDCCQDGEQCVNEMCHRICEHDRCEQLDGSEICCDAGEICVSNQCFKPQTSCIDSYMCDNSEYCDTATNTCLPKPQTEACMATPKGGAVIPTQLWYWGSGNLAPSASEFPNHRDVMSSPMVADVDGDGDAEVIFNSFNGSWNGNGILRILDGKTGKMKAFSNGNPYTDGGSQTAVGDIIPSNPGLEIVTSTAVTINGATYYKLAVFDNKAKLIWQHTEGEYHECGQGGPGIADFNGDGLPEVYSRYNVFNGQTGELIARESCATCGENNVQHAYNEYPVAADINEDGTLELVGGNVAYKVIFPDKEHNVAGKLEPIYFRDDLSDGYPAIGDLDNDGHPEVVIVQPNGNSSLMAIHGKDGSNFWDKPIDTSSIGLGGPATIANLDNTPEPEITFAGKYKYMAYNAKGELLWSRFTHDQTSGKTGSSVFDFDGDGRADVVYADEYFLRVYDGQTGNTKFCKCNTSGTHWEYPVIADVNNDDHAEIVVAGNTTCNMTSCPTSLSVNDGWDECVDSIMKSPNAADRAGIRGVRVFSSPDRDWVNTRKIYNQHAYSITNVSDDGTIPRHPKKNWEIDNLNNFRLNVQPGANYLPDLSIKNVSSSMTCSDNLPLYFTVQNVGWATALPGIQINIFSSASANGSYEKLGSISTTRMLRASESEDLAFTIKQEQIKSNPLYLELTFDETAPTECRNDNNTAFYALTCAIY